MWIVDHMLSQAEWTIILEELKKKSLFCPDLHKILYFTKKLFGKMSFSVL